MKKRRFYKHSVLLVIHLLDNLRGSFTNINRFRIGLQKLILFIFSCIYVVVIWVVSMKK